MSCSAFDINSPFGPGRTFFRSLIFPFLLLVIFTRVIVPPGYMPAPINSGTSTSMFILCGGDAQSAQLINAWQDSHHSMDHHVDGHFSGHGFELCEFDALSLVLADLSGDTFKPVIGAPVITDTPVLVMAASRPLQRNHPARAPPSRYGFQKHSV